MRYWTHRLCWLRLAWIAAVLPIAAPESFAAQPPAAAPAASVTQTPSGGAAPAPQTPQPARWVQRKIYFTYLGFTTHYSCEGLTDKVRGVLLQLGARKADLKVHEAGCTSRAGEPTPFPAVQGTFSVLEPLAGDEASSPAAAEAVVPAHWEAVNVRFDHQELDVSGQCELLEQVKQHILPLFPARNVQFRSLCIPHQLTAGGNSLQAEVLMPDKSLARAE